MTGQCHRTKTPWVQLSAQCTHALAPTCGAHGAKGRKSRRGRREVFKARDLPVTGHVKCEHAMNFRITYGPHKAVAEVSNHNEPIGRRSGTQLVGKSMDFTFNCFVLN